MTQWEYVKGSEADFEGAPDSVTVRIGGEKLSTEYWAESFWSESKMREVTPGDTIGGRLGFIVTKGDVIAERRKVDNLQSRVNDANLGDALKEMFRDVPGTKIDVPYDKYNRPCKGVTIDVYDVLVAFNVTNPALQHLIKKALAVGQRGHKDKNEDLNDILASAKRAIELEERNK